MYSLFIENNVEVNVLIQKANLMQIPNRTMIKMTVGVKRSTAGKNFCIICRFWLYLACKYLLGM